MTRKTALRTLSLLLLLAALALGSQVGTESLRAGGDPPDPTLVDPGNPLPDIQHIYVGSVPPGSEEKPVLVFVHGNGRFAEDWWEWDCQGSCVPMYPAVYHEGYRSAFVTVDIPQEEPSRSIFTNGQTLANQIDYIADHYGVEEVVVIAHSKGGIDSQSAIVHFGANEKVSKLFTLGSPHQGSELADLAFTSPLLYPLANAMGWLGEGLCTITPAYMDYFRALTDDHPANNVDIWTAAGTIYPPIAENPVLGLTGPILANQGYSPNDGFVSVASTALYGGALLFQEPFDHFNVYTYDNAWPYIEEVLERLPAVYLPLATTNGLALNGPVPTRSAPAALTSNIILREGDLASGGTLPVEAGATRVDFLLGSAVAGASPAMVAPDGRRWPMRPVPGAESPLWRVTVDRPAAGLWTLAAEAAGDYALMATLDGPLTVTLQGMPGGPLAAGSALAPDALARGGQVEQILVDERSLSGTFDDCVPPPPPSRVQEGVTGLTGAPAIHLARMTVRGTTAGGTPFERTFVRSYLRQP